MSITSSGSHEIFSAIMQRNKQERANQKALLQTLYPIVSYGAMMTLGQELWREYLDSEYGVPGGEFAIGCCVAMTVPCGCEDENKVHCEWCCGCGWLTKHVKAIKDASHDDDQES